MCACVWGWEGVCACVWGWEGECVHVEDECVHVCGDGKVSVRNGGGEESRGV